MLLFILLLFFLLPLFPIQSLLGDPPKEVGVSQNPFLSNPNVFPSAGKPLCCWAWRAVATLMHSTYNHHFLNLLLDNKVSVYLGRDEKAINTRRPSVCVSVLPSISIQYQASPLQPGLQEEAHVRHHSQPALRPHASLQLQPALPGLLPPRVLTPAPGEGPMLSVIARSLPVVPYIQ